MNSMCCLVNGEGVGWWRIIPLESILSREEYYGFSLSYFRLLIGLTLPHFAVVQATFFLFFFHAEIYHFYMMLVLQEGKAWIQLGNH